MVVRKRGSYYYMKKFCLQNHRLHFKFGDMYIQKRRKGDERRGRRRRDREGNGGGRKRKNSGSSFEISSHRR